MTHHHHESESGNLDRGLWASAALNLGITLVELVGGLWAGSLALLADAAHRLHHVHAWEVGPGQRVLTAHMKVGATTLLEVEAIAAEVRNFLHEEWGITHATLKAEVNGCGREELLREWK